VSRASRFQVVALRLPEPMLARSGKLPTRGGWSFEPKWDGFRAVVRSGDDYRVRSRRGWLMTELLPECAALPVRGVFDGELVAFGDDERPSFHRLCQRMLNRDARVPVALALFAVVSVLLVTTAARRAFSRLGLTYATSRAAPIAPPSSPSSAGRTGGSRVGLKM
jgi:hypothetical protein